MQDLDGWELFTTDWKQEGSYYFLVLSRCAPNAHSVIYDSSTFNSQVTKTQLRSKFF